MSILCILNFYGRYLQNASNDSTSALNVVIVSRHAKTGQVQIVQACKVCFYIVHSGKCYGANLVAYFNVHLCCQSCASLGLQRKILGETVN
jgi:hypothetical protein